MNGASAVPCTVEAIQEGTSTLYRHRIGAATETIRITDSPVRMSRWIPATKEWQSLQQAGARFSINTVCFNGLDLCCQPQLPQQCPPGAGFALERASFPSAGPVTEMIARGGGGGGRGGNRGGGGGNRGGGPGGGGASRAHTGFRAAAISTAVIPARAVAGATTWEAGRPGPRWSVPVAAAGTSVDRTPAAEISIGRVRAAGT
jgi:hypothetical protein